MNFAKERGARKPDSKVMQAAKEREEVVYGNQLVWTEKRIPSRFNAKWVTGLLENVTIQRFNKKLQETDDKLAELQERWKHTGNPGGSDPAPHGRVNIKTVDFEDNPGAFMNYTVKPNFKVAGPILGKKVKPLGKAMATVDAPGPGGRHLRRQGFSRHRGG